MNHKVQNITSHGQEVKEVAAERFPLCDSENGIPYQAKPDSVSSPTQTIEFGVEPESAEKLDDQEDPNLLHQFIRLCEDQSWLIRQQENTIRDLQEQLADYEQELYEKDRAIALLENDLEEISEELFLEVNLR